MKTYKIVAITTLSLCLFSAQGFGDDLFKDKNLKPVMTQSWKNRIMGSLSYGAVLPSAILPSWLTYRYFINPRSPKPLSEMIARASLLFPMVYFNTIPATIVAPTFSYYMGDQYFKEASKLDKYNARIKSK